MRGPHSLFGEDWRHLATFFCAGVVATSLVALAIGPSSPPATQGEGQITPDSPSRPGHRSRVSVKTTTIVPAESAHDLSLQELIAELKRLLAGPDHILTALRLDALLDSIPVAQIPDLIAMGNVELDDRERAAVYERLLKRWVAENPDEALDFVLAERVGSQVDPFNGTKLLNNLFAGWARENLSGARAWLLDRWDHEVLGESTFMESLRQLLALHVMKELLRHEDPSTAFQFISEIPNDGERHAVLSGILGGSSWHSTTMSNMPLADRMNFYRELQRSADLSRRRELLQTAWRRWSEDDSEWIREVSAGLDSADRFELALGWLGLRTRLSKSIPRGDGSFTRENLGVQDRDARAASALEAGLAAGLSRSETLEAMSRVFVDQLPKESLAWMEEHRSEFDADPILAREAREQAAASSWSGGDLPPVVAIRWASLISNEPLRLQLCRGAFLRLIQRDPAVARAYLARPETPQDLLPEFHAILSDTQ